MSINMGNVNVRAIGVDHQYVRKFLGLNPRVSGMRKLCERTSWWDFPSFTTLSLSNRIMAREKNRAKLLVDTKNEVTAALIRRYEAPVFQNQSK